MEAHALREMTHVANRRISLPVPSWLDNQDVEVIVLPRASFEATQLGKKRKPNLLADRGSFTMSEDFDDDLPDSFWLGEDGE
jgi:hypothetical protein